jgi:hypothetical protein
MPIAIAVSHDENEYSATPGQPLRIMGGQMPGLEKPGLANPMKTTDKRPTQRTRLANILRNAAATTILIPTKTTPRPRRP